MFYIRTVFQGMARRRAQSLLTAMLCAGAALLLVLYSGASAAQERQLGELSRSVPVECRIMNPDGTRSVGLRISPSVADELGASGLVSDLKYTMRMQGKLGDAKGDPDIAIVGVSGVEALSPAQRSGLAAGISTPQMPKGADAQCVVSEDFLRNHVSVSVGDTVKLAMYRPDFGDKYMQYTYIADCEVKIAGSFSKTPTQGEDMICPTDFLKAVCSGADMDAVLDSLSFTVADPLRLNAFKSEMKELGLLEINAAAKSSVAGTALFVNDKAFVRSALSLKKNIASTQRFCPVLLAAVVLIGFFVSALLMQSRKREIALMRSAGVGAGACVLMCIFEVMVSALVGSAVGLAIASAFFAQANAAAACVFAAYTLGMAAAAAPLARIKPMRILSQTEGE